MSNGVAAVHWQPSSDKHSVRAYFQDDTDLMLYEIGWDTPEKWYRGNSSRAIGPARRNTPLAVVRANSHHVFYVDTDNAIKEYKWYDHKWVPGATLPATDVSDDTNLTALFCGKGQNLQIRLYYQQKSGDVQELQFRSGAWHTGTVFDCAVPGTKLAVTNSMPNEDMWVLHLFYITPGAEGTDTFRIVHKKTVSNDTYWVSEELTPTVAADAGLAGVAWPEQRGFRMRLYFPDAAGDVVEFGYDSTRSHSWDDAPKKPSNTMSSMSKPLAAAHPGMRALTGLEVFVKKEKKEMVEMFSEFGRWKEPKDLDWNSL
ncbi:fungal fucose-specific lectin-domain-containing protein [Mycena galericulata]|nr:fungal fucose-specific lectin-domain-containing protein [Mycena galericulata]